METIQTHEAALALRQAAESAELKRWTAGMTSVIISTFPKMGWCGAARGHRSNLLPIPRSEYLELDVVAFNIPGDRKWRFPVGVFELENSRINDPVAYSLWKVLCVRASLRVVVCYRRDAHEASELMRHLSDELIQSIEIPIRAGLGGETLVIVGSQSETASFPYGFFKVWTLDLNTARFRRT